MANVIKNFFDDLGFSEEQKNFLFSYVAADFMKKENGKNHYYVGMLQKLPEGIIPLDSLDTEFSTESDAKKAHKFAVNFAGIILEMTARLYFCVKNNSDFLMLTADVNGLPVAIDLQQKKRPPTQKK